MNDESRPLTLPGLFTGGWIHMVKLTPRLQALADRVRPNSSVTDVGTDHGYVPAWLVQAGRCSRVWATDIQKGPLRNAEETLQEEGLAGQIELRLGPGLAPMRGEAPQCILIAGMGGILMAEILEADLPIARGAEQLLLQPMSGVIELRRWLVTHGFKIVGEALVQEGHRMYTVIEAAPGEGQEPDAYHDLVGYCLPDSQDPLFPVFVAQQIRRLEKIIAEAGASEGTDALIAECRQLTARLREELL